MHKNASSKGLKWSKFLPLAVGKDVRSRIYKILDRLNKIYKSETVDLLISIEALTAQKFIVLQITT